jgi:hypothetical protein
VPELFELTELASYMQQDLDAATATLNRELATTRIRRVIGTRRWDGLTEQQATDLKPIALDIAKRLTENPNGLRQTSHSIDDYTESQQYAIETVGGTGLTQQEIDDIRGVFGLAGGAFSIAPKAPARRHGWNYVDCIRPYQ